MAAVIVAIGLAITIEVVVRRAGPILKGRVIETLSTRFDARVELDDLQVFVRRGLEVRGAGLRIYPPDDVASGTKTPLIALKNFSFDSGLIGLFFKPMHVGSVNVSGLVIGARRPCVSRDKAAGLPNGHKRKDQRSETLSTKSFVRIRG